MQFIKDNGLYKVARITGPQHNLLAIRLSERNTNTEIVSLPIMDGEKRKIEASDVLHQVKLGLATINKEVGKEYFISEVQFVPTDSKSSNVYELLIIELIKRIHTQGKFITV